MMKNKNKINYIDLVFRLNLLAMVVTIGAFLLTVGFGISVGVAATVFAPIFIPLAGMLICVSYILAHKNQIQKALTQQKLDKASYRLMLAQDESAKLSNQEVALNQRLNNLLSATTTMNVRLQQEIKSDVNGRNSPRSESQNVERLKAHVGTFTGKKDVGLDKISSDPESANIEIDVGLSRLLEEQNVTDKLLEQRAGQIRIMQSKGL